MFNLKTLSLIAISCLAQYTIAQTPDGFTPATTQTLDEVFGNTQVSPAGLMVARDQTANPPTISSRVMSTTGRALIIMLDLDVPRNNSRATLLHWLVPDVTMSSQNSSLRIPNPPGNGGAAYLQPSPPVGDIAHRYVQLLFSQPSNFAIPASFGNLTANRVGFNLTQFIAATKIGAPLAANFIRVQQTNTTTTGRTTTATAAATAKITNAVTVLTSGGSRTTSARTSGAPAMVTANAAPPSNSYGDAAVALLAPLLFAAWI